MVMKKQKILVGTQKNRIEGGFEVNKASWHPICVILSCNVIHFTDSAKICFIVLDCADARQFASDIWVP